MNDRPVANGLDSLHGSKEPTKGGRYAGNAAVAKGDGYVQAPGQEEDDGRGLLTGGRSSAGSFEVR